MQTVILIMFGLACFSFLLKQTFHGIRIIMGSAVILLFFAGLMWPFAIEQSRTMISSWMADGQLMLDMAVWLSIDVALTLLFCTTRVDVKTSVCPGRWKRVLAALLNYYPGITVFPVVFALLVGLVFLFTGMDFKLISWGFGAVLFVLVPSITVGLRSLVPEVEIRLELLFLVNVLLALMGIIATVNGRTAVTATQSFDLKSLLFVCGIVIAGTGFGYLLNNYVRHKRIMKIDKRK